jgi:hypothetical protein
MKLKLNEEELKNNCLNLTINDLLEDNRCEDEFTLLDDEYEDELPDSFYMPYHPDPDKEYIPRDYQQELWNGVFNRWTKEDFKLGLCEKDQVGDYRILDGSVISKRFRRMILVWHRRAGKDINTWHLFLLCAALNPGVYFYMLPTIAQGRKAIFDTIANDGTKFIDYLPKQLYLNGVGWNKQDMKIEIDLGEVNGIKRVSIIQILGSDNYDRIVGTNPKGIVFSEFALCNPTAWDFFRPILKLNDGFAWFISTPRGKNHFYRLVEKAKELKDTWYVSIKNIHDTKLLTHQDYLDEINEGMEEPTARQEYLCDFDAPVKGTYYSEMIGKVYSENRFEVFIPNKGKEVYCAFDIGVNDKTCILFWQESDEGFDIIDYYDNDGEALDHYVRYIKQWENINQMYVKEIYFPHDMNVKEFAGGNTRIKVARDAMPDKTCKVLERSSVNEGIDCLRRVLNYCRFMKNKNVLKLIDGLQNYRKEYNEKKQEFMDNPVHDWASHPSDTARYFAMVVDRKIKLKKRRTVAVKANNMSSGLG